MSDSSINIDDILQVFDDVASLKTLALKETRIIQDIYIPGLPLLLNIMAAEVIKRPKMRHTTREPNDLLTDIISYFNTQDSSKLSFKTLKVLSYLSTPKTLGLTKGQLLLLLVDVAEVINIYEVLGRPIDIPVCAICGDTEVTETGICEPCKLELERFTEYFYSTEPVVVTLNYKNFKRSIRQQIGNFTVHYMAYTAQHLSNSTNKVKFTWNGTKFQPKLPFIEYALSLN